MFLIADASWGNLWGYAHIAKMAFGLGMVIFVHELGHFLVAKACGVKCEKFYVGFDMPMPKIGPFQIPSKFFSFQWGETEYGLGIVPLGGYVKMLGQDDNPANAEKEAEKTRVKSAVSDQQDSEASSAETAAGKVDHHKSVTDVDLEPQPLAEDVDYELDPRSYTAKNVPQRMAIISAGVIMNIIFAVVFATVAYRIGVPYTPSIVGGTVPGSPAWQANLPVGHRILEVGDKGGPREHLRFANDFTQDVILDGKQGDIQLLLRNDLEETKSTASFSLTPQMRDAGWLLGELPYIGVTPPATAILSKKDPLIAGFSAADSSLQAGDEIIAGTVHGERQELANFWEMYGFLARNVDEKVTLHAKRTTVREGGSKDESFHDAKLERQPLRRLGLALTMGPVTAIQKGSAAEQAGVQIGDVLDAVNGTPLADPLIAPDVIRRLAGQEVTLSVLREGTDGKRQPVELTITPAPVTTYRSRPNSKEPMLVDALGLVYTIDKKISALTDASEASKKFQVGDEVVRVQVIPASASQEDKDKLKKASLTDEEIDLNEEGVSWPHVAIGVTQWLPEGAKLRVTVKRGDQNVAADLTPFDSQEFSFPSRGLALRMEEEVHQAETWGEAFSLGVRETKESLLLVVKFLKRLVTGSVPITGLGGPGMIIAAASNEASVDTSRLLIFLTMLSANLAVVNFLPIPVLDGGHMVFLLYEGIFRRPVNETWQIRLSLLGFAFLLSLMAFVIGLDIVRFSGLG